MPPVKRTVFWADSAWNAYIDTLNFYKERNGSPDYSRKLDKRITEKIEMVRFFPEWGEPLREEIARRLIVEKFVLLYDHTEDAVFIRFFADGRRNPELFPY